MAHQNAKHGGDPGTATRQNPRPSSVTIKAPGDAPATGMLKTPAPMTSVELALAKDRAWGRESYGAGGYNGPVETDPGKTMTSPLADNLKAKNAEGDGGDHLQDIIEHGTARNSMVTLKSSETRDLSDKSEGNREASPVHPAMKRQQTPSKVGDVVVGTLPATLGASAEPAPFDHYVDQPQERGAKLLPSER